MTVITLAKPRHDAVIAEMQKLGVRVFAIPDGDVAASVLACMPLSEVDMMYCVGGAPEGVISAAVIRALGGDMQGRLIPRNQVKEDNAENQRIAADEIRRCEEQSIQVNSVLQLHELAKNDNVIFSATGITKGDLLEGINRQGNIATTETLLVRGKTRTIRKIQSTHYLDRKNDELKAIIL
jgi:fructose-1,6-bisphosphatase II